MQGNRDALAIVRVPTEEEEQARAIHRQREQLVGARKRLEAQGRSLLVNHGLEPVQNWWKPRTFATLAVPQWMRELLLNSQPILLALQKGEHALQEIKILWNVGAAGCLTCSECPSCAST